MSCQDLKIHRDLEAIDQNIKHLNIKTLLNLAKCAHHNSYDVMVENKLFVHICLN